MPDISELLPSDLAICELLPRLDHKSLLALAATSKHWRALSAYPPLWQSLFSARWGQQPLNAAAAQLAGSWQAYFKSKHLSAKDAAAAKEPYEKPCCFEVDARLQSLASQAILQQHLPCHTAAHVLPFLPTSPPPRMLLAEQDASSNSTCSTLSYPPRGSPPHGPGQAAFLSASSSCSTTLPSCSSSPSHSSVGSMSPALFVPEELPPAPPPCQIVYLIDGSGSVSDEDFGEMRTFVQSSAHTLCGRLQGSPGNAAAGKVGVIQFSHDPHTELPLTALGDGSDLAGVLDKMARINGGTNIEAALSAASSLFSKASLGFAAVPEGSGQEGNAAGRPASTSAGGVHAGPSIPPARMVILLTDGRVGRYEAHSARAAAKRLLQNLQGGGGCVLAAFGVGRGVECSDLVHIIDVEGAGGAEARDRYLDLFVRDDHGSW